LTKQCLVEISSQLLQWKKTAQSKQSPNLVTLFKKLAKIKVGGFIKHHYFLCTPKDHKNCDVASGTADRGFESCKGEGSCTFKQLNYVVFMTRVLCIINDLVEKRPKNFM
jgi:hypothetical protein